MSSPLAARSLQDFRSLLIRLVDYFNGEAAAVSVETEHFGTIYRSSVELVLDLVEKKLEIETIASVVAQLKATGGRLSVPMLSAIATLEARSAELERQVRMGEVAS